MKRMILLLALAMAISPCRAEEHDRDRQQEPQTYESPILSLLFLPANILIKMASVFAPKGGQQAKPEPPAARDGSSR